MRNLKYGFILLIFSFQACASCSVGPGLTYRHERRTDPRQLSVHILQVDPAHNRIGLAHAQQYGTDREEVSSIARRTGALAALNGSNYRRGGRYNGNSINLSIIDHEFISDPAVNSGAIGWDSDGKALISCVKVAWNLRIGGKEFPIHRMNQPREDDETILYTTAFRPTTITNMNGSEVIIKENKVVALREHTGNAKIPHNGYVYSVGSGANVGLKDIVPGMPVELTSSLISEDGNDAWNRKSTVLGGAGILLLNGMINQDFDAELHKGRRIARLSDELGTDLYIDAERNWYVNVPHPRTAVGIKSDGAWMFVVVDGRQPGLSEGVTLQELSQIMLELGCVQAINLGGGGCTTMYIDGSVMNSPSGGSFTGKHERPVSEAFIITSKGVEGEVLK